MILIIESDLDYCQSWRIFLKGMSEDQGFEYIVYYRFSLSNILEIIINRIYVGKSSYIDTFIAFFIAFFL